MKKFLLSIALIVGISFAWYLIFIISPKLNILNGYAAKKACSCYYIADRNLESIKSEDLATSPLNLATLQLDTINKTLSSSVFGFGKRTASYIKGRGCTLRKAHNNAIQNKKVIRNISQTDSLPWPYGSTEIVNKKYGVDQESIKKANDLAFDSGTDFIKKTRALIIVQNDTVVSERYAPGYDRHTELLGWSMTKSITNILIGILVKQGTLSIQDTSLFEVWKDNRTSISLDDMLRMSSGLAWEEVYSEVADATNMLFLESNMPAYVLKNKLEYPPGSHFEYSSGTTNLLSLLIRRQFQDEQSYLEFPYTAVFDKLGLSNIVLETDASNHYVLSSYCYATPLDWTKLGLLYLHKGLWNGEEIFTEDWYNYSIRPTEASPDQSYGAHIWLNTNHNDLKDAPENIFRFSGFEGQYVYIIPSYNAVVVRMGLSEGPPFDMNEVLRLILEGLAASPAHSY